MKANRTIDRVWPWLVCLGAGLTNFVASGGTRSMGILFVQLQQRFQSNAAITGLVLGFSAAGFAIFSVIGNVLGSFCGYRAVAVAGAAVTFVSLLLTAFAQDINLVVVTMGLATGIGYGLMYGPSTVVVGQYFNKRRDQAKALAAAGGNLGLVQEAAGSFAQSLRICGLFLVAGGMIINVQHLVQKFQNQRTSPGSQSKITEACQNFPDTAADNLILFKETVI